ncbi:hypothetical protein GCM10009610_55500 [Pseudonocardia xinjiangensis]
MVDDLQLDVGVVVADRAEHMVDQAAGGAQDEVDQIGRHDEPWTCGRYRHRNRPHFQRSLIWQFTGGWGAEPIFGPEP